MFAAIKLTYKIYSIDREDIIRLSFYPNNMNICALVLISNISLFIMRDNINREINILYKQHESRELVLIFFLREAEAISFAGIMAGVADERLLTQHPPLHSSLPNSKT